MSLFKTKSGKVRKSPIVAGGVLAGLVVLGNLMPTQPEPIKADPAPIAEAEPLPTPAPEVQPAPTPESKPAPAVQPAPAPAPGPDRYRTLREVPQFDAINPYTNSYMIALEKTGLAKSQGEQRLYGLGLGVCRNLDRGHSIGQEVDDLAAQARLGDRAGSIVGAAAAHMCGWHRQAAEDYVSAHK